MMVTTLLPFLIFLSSSISALGVQSSHVVNVHSLMPSNVCSPPKDIDTRLRVVDRHGPCSTLPASGSISLEQILSKDQLRVNLIQSRVAALSGQADKSGTVASSKIIAQYGDSFGNFDYIVSIGIGTPSKTQTVVFDTGSDVTWVQCEPCNGSCYQQKEPIFDPSKSPTFHNVPCNSTQCEAVSYSCSGSSCLYSVGYGDGSYTFGYYAEDKLTIGSDVIQNFRFGCGQNNGGLFGEIAGLLGLGPAADSFLLQTSEKYQRIFAYCLPENSSSTGYLSFGKSSNTPNTKWTPIPKHPNPPYYYINMTGISVGGLTLGIASTVFSNAAMIIDSGTVITRLPPDAYQVLRSTFRENMKQYKMVQGYSLLDTCYDFTGFEFDTVPIPAVGVQFLNGVSLDLDGHGILTGPNISQMCLAFAGNSNPSDLTIFGNVQQRTFNVVYDVPNGQIGFSPKAC